MTANAPAPWEQLFPAPDPGGRTVTLPCRLIRKRGEPLLLLPARGGNVAAALALYPAQTLKARGARALLGWSLRAGLTAGTTPVVVRLAAETPFVRWLGSHSAGAELRFALFFGNPRAPGRRFILLPFGPAGQPERLVKAGVGDQAVSLIRAEAAFLKSFPAETLQAPALLDEFADGRLAALAMRYAAGPNPRAAQLAPALNLLTSWIQRQATVKLTDLPVWRRLEKVSGPPPWFPRLAATVATATFHPAIYHGDFAPWNIRVDPASKRWAVLDWERGAAMGPPAWDWFHFLIQPRALVRRRAPEAILEAVERHCAAPAFRAYAQTAGIEGGLRPLLVAYLWYCRDVLRQTEGGDTIDAVGRLAVARWLEAGAAPT
jgi:hypothetical protein